MNKNLYKDLRILYVEDDEMTAEEVAFFLSSYVKELYIAKNGQEGLELFKEHEPDMVIIDIQMPIKNGLEMSKEILNIKPNTPIAITTAYSDSDYIMKALEMGIDKYIIKPTNLQDVLLIISKSLNLDVEIKQKELCDDYIDFILNNNSSCMLILDNKEVRHVSKSLLQILGYDDIQSIKEKFTDNNFIKLDKDEKNENCLEYILKNKKESFYVTLQNEENSNQKEFELSCKKFDKLNKILLLLNPLCNKEN